MATTPSPIIIGVLALQGAFAEHLTLLRHAASTSPALNNGSTNFNFIEVRTAAELSQCNGLIIPGGESTSISLIAERTGLLDPLRQFVKLDRRPVWGTCAGLILLAESANRTKATGQALIGGLDVRVQRNYFGRQVESFEADLDLPFLLEHGDSGLDAAAAGAAEGDGVAAVQAQRFHSVFIRAPVVEAVLPSTSRLEAAGSMGAEPSPSSTSLLSSTLQPSNSETGALSIAAEDSSTHIAAPQIKPTSAPVEILARLPGRARALPPNPDKTAAQLGEDGDIVAVRQGNVFGTAFHPELTGDARIHAWWLGEVLQAVSKARLEQGR